MFELHVTKDEREARLLAHMLRARGVLSVLTPYKLATYWTVNVSQADLPLAHSIKRGLLD
jgi:hypothetical protein